jgi:hypothetical protein
LNGSSGQNELKEKGYVTTVHACPAATSIQLLSLSFVPADSVANFHSETDEGNPSPRVPILLHRFKLESLKVQTSICELVTNSSKLKTILSASRRHRSGAIERHILKEP